MKLINEKGRLFGIINVVDLAILLIIVLLAAAVAVKTTGGKIKSSGVGAQKTVTVVLKASAKSDAVLTAFHKGDQLMYGSLMIDNAYVTNVKLSPTMVNVELPTGEILLKPDPLLKDIYITFTAPVPAGSTVVKLENQEIRVGATYIIYTKNAQTAGYVQEIKYNQ